MLVTIASMLYINVKLAKNQSLFKIIGEISLFAIVIGIINLFFPDNPGFLKLFFNPYVAFSLVISSYYGKYYAFYAIIFSSFIVGLLVPLSIMTFYGGYVESIVEYWKSISGMAVVPLAVGIIGVYLFDLIREVHVSRARRDRERLKQLAMDKAVLKQEVRALKLVNSELEKRVYGQEDSLTTLYTRIQDFQSVNLNKALSSILETVGQFTGASKCSIWEYRQEGKTLELKAHYGWDEGMINTTVLPAEDCIEGWVVRNNAMFSAKMLLQYENLRRMDKGRNLFTAPLLAGRKVWGVINIEDMPFEKYNIYTEKMLQLIIALSATALEKAIEYESIVKQEDTNPITGLPSYTNFLNILENRIETARVERGTLSVIIVEMRNFEFLSEIYGKNEVLKIFAVLVGIMKEISSNKGRFFHYKNDNQLAMIYPNIDFDGASLYSLDVLAKINSTSWEIRGNKVQLDIIIGYSSLTDKIGEADQLLEVAENLIEMQKI